MSHVSEITNGFQFVGNQLKAIRLLVNNNAAGLAALSTSEKGNLVAAINEVYAEIQAVASSAGATINDSASSSTTQTYSVNKIKSEISTSVTNASSALKAEILGGADAAFDTLKELQTFIQNEATELDAVLTALGNRLRTDTAAQGLTTTQQANARTNIDVYSKAEIGDVTTNYVSVVTTAIQ